MIEYCDPGRQRCLHALLKTLIGEVFHSILLISLKWISFENQSINLALILRTGNN